MRPKRRGACKQKTCALADLSARRLVPNGDTLLIHLFATPGLAGHLMAGALELQIQRRSEHTKAQCRRIGLWPRALVGTSGLLSCKNEPLGLCRPHTAQQSRRAAKLPQRPCDGWSGTSRDFCSMMFFLGDQTMRTFRRHQVFFAWIYNIHDVAYNHQAIHNHPQPASRPITSAILPRDCTTKRRLSPKNKVQNAT